jgi:putative salt-induced outer membrane protein YdiY
MMCIALRYCVIFGLGLGATVVSSLAHAQDLGKPPPEADKAVAGPGKAPEAPKLAPSPEGTNAAVSAGGLSSSGNSRLVAFTGSGNFDWRGGKNGVGASLVGNYGKSAPPGGDMTTTTENAQGRVRYDRYVIEDASVFLLATGRHDRFQGLAFRFNLDPGFKYLFVNRPAIVLWAEAGYDFQYDTRTREAREIRDDMGVLLERLDKHETDHSARVFLGFRHAFNDSTALSNGIEYLQSFVHSKRYRFNYDVLFTAKVWGDLAVGAGFNARYDNQPLPDKEQLDMTSTLSLIYAYTSVVKQ